MNYGKIFEDEWRKNMPKDKVYYFRIKDSAMSFGRDSKFTRFTLTNPYDCFAFYNRYFFPMELKTTKNTSFSIQRDKDSGSKMIKFTQIIGLEQASKYEGIFAGFVLNFTTEEHTYWLDINDFLKFLKDNEKKSINEKDVIEYNGILINQTKNKVTYSYDIIDLFDRITQRGGYGNGKENEI